MRRDTGDSEWNVLHPTLDLLRKRRGEDSQPGHRPPGDDAQIALIIEGGGMRGIVSAAMLSALDDLGYKCCFDVVYGYSAGAVNAAYFLAGETWYPLSIYYDHLASRRFVNFFRPLCGLPIMNLQFAFDEVVDHRIPLDYGGVCASAAPLRIALSMTDTNRAELASDFRDAADLREALVATCWLPLATPGTARFRGRPALDGGVLMPSMLEAAEKAGATHILSLRTQRVRASSALGRLGRRFVADYLNRLSPKLGEAYRDEWAALAYPDEMRRAQRALVVGPLPHHRPLLRHETDAGTLLAAAREAYASMYALLERVSREDLLAGEIAVVPRLTATRRASIWNRTKL